MTFVIPVEDEQVNHLSLVEDVQRIVDEHSGENTYTREEFMDEVVHYGCESGMVGELVYYVDTTAWYNKHKEEINAMISELVEEMGAPIGDILTNFDNTDALCLQMHNQNLLAWFSFEETCRHLLEDGTEWEGVE